jgi:putative hydrolase of the HAD superfamily
MKIRTPNTSKLKAIIFDVDGVVFHAHTNDGGYLWSRTIKKDLGLRSHHFSVIFSQKWNEIIRGKLNLEDHLKLIFQQDIFKELDITPQKYIQYWLSRDHHVNHDILKLVQELDTPCYLGTNQEVLRTTHIMETVGSYFKDCFASYKIGFAKPESKFFSHIENTLSLAPHELLLIDDMNGYIEGAQNCGWHTYHYQNDIKGLMNFLKKYGELNGE